MADIEKKDAFVWATEEIVILKLNAEMKELVAREQILRDEIDKIIAEIEVEAWK